MMVGSTSTLFMDGVAMSHYEFDSKYLSTLYYDHETMLFYENKSKKADTSANVYDKMNVINCEIGSLKDFRRQYTELFI